MNELQTIQQTVESATSRLRLLRGWRGLWWGLLFGASVYLGALATYKLAPIGSHWVSIAAILGLVAIPLGFLVGWWPQPVAAHVARWLDERQKLSARLGTALEFSRTRDENQSPDQSDWHRLILSDAASAARHVRVQQLLPWKLPEPARWCIPILALAAGLGFAPEFRSATRKQLEKEKLVMKETGKQLAHFAKRNLDDRKPVEPEVQKSMESMGDLGNKLQAAKLSRSDALKELASVADRMRQEMQELGRNPAIKKLEQAARSPSSSTASATAQQMQKQIDAMQKSLGDKSGKPSEAIDQLKKDLQALKEASKGMANQDGAQGGAARSELAKMASELARKAESLGMSLPSLDEAVAALNAAQVEQFLRDLNVAERDLEKLADTAKSLAQMQQQLEKLGKDLPEQLKNGQAQAAVASLQKMMDQLKSNPKGTESLKAMMSELENALDPAKPYGKVPGLLKDALAKIKEGQSGQATGKLDEAQKELQNLMEQMGDLEGLMASLANLQKAQQCIGNCQSWGSASSPSGGKPGRSKGGKGYGTWADDDPWATPDKIDDLWDNSGIARADQDGRKHQDRDASTPDNLAPTKVKGQLQPGGPMPSITLRGVSIKGQSSVEFQQTSAAAQTDAQAALQHEQVPKAYRNAVRDYFDDFKK